MKLEFAHSYLIAAVLVPIVAASAAAAPAEKGQWGTGYQWGSKTNSAPAAKTNLSKTELLMKNDNLVPTQNRTQAMRLEAETGHINPQVDSALKPMLKPQKKPVPYAMKKVHPRRATISHAKHY